MSRGTATINAKQPRVLAGGGAAARAFRLVAAGTKVRVLRLDGEAIEKGTTLMEASGSVRSLLTAERTALNFIKRLSGIATLTRRFVDAVKPHQPPQSPTPVPVLTVSGAAGAKAVS